MVIFQVAGKSYSRSHALPDHRCNRRARDPHLGQPQQPENKNRVENNIRYGS